MSDDGDDGLPPVGEEWLSEEPWEDDSLAQFEEGADHLDAQIRAQEKRNKLNFTLKMEFHQTEPPCQHRQHHAGVAPLGLILPDLE